MSLPMWAAFCKHNNAVFQDGIPSLPFIALPQNLSLGQQRSHQGKRWASVPGSICPSAVACRRSRISVAFWQSSLAAFAVFVPRLGSHDAAGTCFGACSSSGRRGGARGRCPAYSRRKVPKMECAHEEYPCTLGGWAQGG